MGTIRPDSPAGTPESRHLYVAIFERFDDNKSSLPQGNFADL